MVINLKLSWQILKVSLMLEQCQGCRGMSGAGRDGGGGGDSNQIEHTERGCYQLK
jgi:hypothetical protein